MAPDSPRKVEIPRWVQLVGLPLILVGAWQLVSAVSHAVFIFVVAALIAILLNPIVRAFCGVQAAAAARGARRLRPVRGGVRRRRA